MQKMQNKNYLKIISITQNTFYAYRSTFQNIRKKDAFASKSQPYTINILGSVEVAPKLSVRHRCVEAG
jgi:hypothetical protein